MSGLLNGLKLWLSCEMSTVSSIFSAKSVKEGDDDRRLVASDVTAYVHKNQYRVVPFPFKVRISKGDDVKRIISDKPI